MQSPCLADYILHGHFGQEAVRSKGEQLGRTSTSRIGPYSTDDLGSRLTLTVTAYDPVISCGTSHMTPASRSFTAPFDAGLLIYQVMKDFPLIVLIDVFWIDETTGPGHSF